MGKELETAKVACEEARNHTQLFKMLGKTLHEIQGLRSNLRLLGARMQEALGILYSLPSSVPLDQDVPRLFLLNATSEGQQVSTNH